MSKLLIDYTKIPYSSLENDGKYTINYTNTESIVNSIIIILKYYRELYCYNKPVHLIITHRCDTKLNTNGISNNVKEWYDIFYNNDKISKLNDLNTVETKINFNGNIGCFWICLDNCTRECDLSTMNYRKIHTEDNIREILTFVCSYKDKNVFGIFDTDSRILFN